MKKKMLLIVSLVMLLSLTACSNCNVYTNDSSTTINTTTPKVIVKPTFVCCSMRGSYCASTSEHGAICSGSAYTSKSAAISSPLSIQSQGNAVTIILSSSNETVTKTLNAGDSELISCGDVNLYVIIN